MSQEHDPALDFSDLPPFPSDVSTAPLLRLSLQKLLDNDAEETSRLFNTCRDIGFFYLDLRDAHGKAPASTGEAKTSGYVNGHTNGNVNGNAQSEDMIDGNSFLSDAAALFGTADEFFQLPVEEKVKYDFKDIGSYHGYKGYGAGIIDKKGTTDRNEFYNTAKDDILGRCERLPAPECMVAHRTLFSSYITTAHAIVTLILDRLTSQLHLPANSLTSIHRLHADSGDQVRFVRAPPQPPQDQRAALGAHTDFGSTTLLFNRIGGLQILPPATDTLDLPDDAAKAPYWQYVRPLRGHCIVNLGDAMVKLTRGVLRSNIHRVVNPPGAQADSLRFSLVYFNRPEDEVLLKPLQGSDVIDAKKTGTNDDEDEVITAKEWVLRRALGRRSGGDFDKSGGTEASRGMRQVTVN